MADSIVIGICGRSGSGKTTVVEKLVARGCKRIDADIFARRAMKNGSECLKEIRSTFGNNVFFASGELDRKALADIIFSSDEERLKLNKITLKYIVRSMRKSAAYYKRKHEKYIIYDAPLLFEGKLDKECDIIVSVVSSDEECIKRIIARDGITKEKAILRLRSQKTNDFLTDHSDIVVYNNGTIEELENQTDKVFESLSELKKNKK